MGLRGPAPTPTAILNARGSWRAKRTNEPTPPSGTPERPAWCAGEAAKIWRRLLPLLEGMGVLAACDAGAIGRYCVEFSRWISAQAVLRKEGETFECITETGVTVKLRPEVAIVTKLATVLQRLEAEFGLTPSARARLAIGAGEKKTLTDAARFFEELN